MPHPDPVICREVLGSGKRVTAFSSCAQRISKIARPSSSESWPCPQSASAARGSKLPSARIQLAMASFSPRSDPRRSRSAQNFARRECQSSARDPCPAISCPEILSGSDPAGWFACPPCAVSFARSSARRDPVFSVSDRLGSFANMAVSMAPIGQQIVNDQRLCDRAGRKRAFRRFIARGHRCMGGA